MPPPAGRTRPSPADTPRAYTPAHKNTTGCKTRRTPDKTGSGHQAAGARHGSAGRRAASQNTPAPAQSSQAASTHADFLKAMTASAVPPFRVAWASIAHRGANVTVFGLSSHLNSPKCAKNAPKNAPRSRIINHGSRGVADTRIYSSRMPARSQAAVVSSSHMDACTSPMCALPSSSMDRRDWPMPPPIVGGSCPASSIL